MQAKNKTDKDKGAVDAYLSAISSDTRREDCKKILEIMKAKSGWEPKMWGSIVGFGDYHYKYETGREGDYFRVGFSSRAQNISVYIMPGYQDFSDELALLGKHKMGKACLYIENLSDIDQAVFEEIVEKGLKIMAEKYPLEN